MIETAETKIWVIALIMLISFVFNWLKKKRGENIESEEAGVDGAWGINDIIQQFEDELGAHREETPREPDMVYNDKPVKEAVPERDYENESHSAFESVNTKPKKKLTDQEDDVEVEYDLKQMIIHNTILNRPEY